RDQQPTAIDVRRPVDRDLAEDALERFQIGRWLHRLARLGDQLLGPALAQLLGLFARSWFFLRRRFILGLFGVNSLRPLVVGLQLFRRRVCFKEPARRYLAI